MQTYTHYILQGLQSIFTGNASHFSFVIDNQKFLSETIVLNHVKKRIYIINEKKNHHLFY